MRVRIGIAQHPFGEMPRFKKYMNVLLCICSAQYTTPLCEYSKFYSYYCGENSNWQTKVTQGAQF